MPSIAAACLALALAGCSEPPAQDEQAPSRASTPGLRAALTHAAGAFEWSDATRSYVFTDKAAIEKLVGKGSDQQIRELVDCLDDETPSRATLNGQPVPVGVMCYQALSQTIYYEPTAKDGDLAADWPGHLEPTATPQELAAAKRAWIDVVNRNAYRRL